MEKTQTLIFSPFMVNFFTFTQSYIDERSLGSVATEFSSNDQSSVAKPPNIKQSSIARKRSDRVKSIRANAWERSDRSNNRLWLHLRSVISSCSLICQNNTVMAMLEWAGSGGSPPVHLQLWRKKSPSDRQSEREARLKRRVLPISLNSSFKNIIQAEGLFSS